MSVEPIRVELEAFCQKFTTALEPFSEALEQSTGTLREAVDGERLQAVLGDLQDNRHRLKILLDKARQQNTYLVIFGPLKSGKSTLMNAISGAYVSEVSSLPAYPCLVYVREGEEHGFSTTAFNGDRTDYASRDQLHDSLQSAHENLAKRIREAEASGAAFNPAQDFTEAIRRIDFTMPAPYLRESGTILVDTPGLYTKMKYNYGQLTRDFRDTAACAVFVVKTDNLFFEQVFEEFADLLEVFSRVFLVVNIDSSKQDLGPDGSLEPSLEQQDPKRIVEAFENLTVSAQIREAIDSGRLRIYLIDLLQTAMRSLQSGNPGGRDDETTEAAVAPGQADDETRADTAPEPASAAEAAPAPVGGGPRIGFEHFLEDLTDYLNSSEYIVEFMADSLRQARSILLEVKERAHAPEIAELREGIDALKTGLERTERRLATVDQLRDHRWEGPLEELSREIWQQVTEHSGSLMPQLEKDLNAEIETWATTGESMRDLVEDRLLAKIRASCRSARGRATELFDGACKARNGGLRLSDEVSRHLHALDLDFDDVYAAFQPTVRERFEAEPEPSDPSGLQDALPLRKRFVDWLLFRNQARLRRHVLGGANPSEKPIPAGVKAKRIDEEGLREFAAAAGDYARRCALESLEGELENLLGEYRERFRKEARERLDGQRGALQGEHDDLRRQLQLRQNVLEALDRLDTASGELDARALELREEFVAGKRAIPVEATAEDENPEPAEQSSETEGPSHPA